MTLSLSSLEPARVSKGLMRGAPVRLVHKTGGAASSHGGGHGSANAGGLAHTVAHVQDDVTLLHGATSMHRTEIEAAGRELLEENARA